jgi:lipoprotein-anchoring transpeptidase ErfK/SrfK
MVIRISASSLLVGQSVTATVVVVPRTAGRVVFLQRQGTGHWRNLVSGATNKMGRAVLHLSFPNVGDFRLRASVAASAEAGPAVSPSNVLEVSPVPPPYAGAVLAPGDVGAQVLALQQRLTSLGYWLGTPNGSFGDATEQAVLALQKAAGIATNGLVGPPTVAALAAGALPTPRATKGYAIEVNLKTQLVMFVNNGQIVHVLNTSTGGGYTYTEGGASDVAITPTGVFHIERAINGLVKDTLGLLWRPRYFYDGYAIHGDGYVPAVAVSHGCVRVSNEAIDWIWSEDLAPIGTEVWVY